MAPNADSFSLVDADSLKDFLTSRGRTALPKSQSRRNIASSGERAEFVWVHEGFAWDCGCDVSPEGSAWRYSPCLDDVAAARGLFGNSQG
jgi:hypothetical protein